MSVCQSVCLYLLFVIWCLCMWVYVCMCVWMPPCKELCMHSVCLCHCFYACTSSTSKTLQLDWSHLLINNNCSRIGFVALNILGSHLVWCASFSLLCSSVTIPTMVLAMHDLCFQQHSMHSTPPHPSYLIVASCGLDLSVFIALHCIGTSKLASAPICLTPLQFGYNAIVLQTLLCSSDGSHHSPIHICTSHVTLLAMHPPIHWLHRMSVIHCDVNQTPPCHCLCNADIYETFCLSNAGCQFSYIFQST